MRSVAEIKKDIEFTEETLKNPKLKAKDRETFQESLDDLKDELNESQAHHDKKSEEKEVKPTKAELSKDEKFLEKEIKELKELIDDDDVDDDEKGLYKKQLKDLEGQLEKLEKKQKETPAEKKEEHKAPAEKKTSKKKASAKAKEEKETPAKKEEKEEARITVAGKKYNMNDCKQAIEAAHAREKQREKSGKKYKSKSPAEKAAANVKTAVNQIADGISDKKIEENPKQVIKALQTFHKKLTEGFKALEGVLKNKSYLTKLTQSLKAIDEVIAEIEKEQD